MFHSHFIKSLTVVVMLVVLVTGTGYLLSTTVAIVRAAAPTCGAVTFNAATLSASELYYAQQAERFMAHEPCSALPVSGISASQLDCADEASLQALSPSEIYYAQMARRFMPCESASSIASPPQ